MSKEVGGGLNSDVAELGTATGWLSEHVVRGSSASACGELWA